MTGIYRDVLPAIVRVLAADVVDNTAKQSWQRLIERKVDGGFRALLSARDQFEFDCMLHALLHRELTKGEWDVLHARYSTHSDRRGQAIEQLSLLVKSPAPARFFERAIATWAIPRLKGTVGKRSTSIIVLPDSWYDMNNWDEDARPDSTRSRWRRDIRRALDCLEEQAMVHVTEILSREKLVEAG